MISNLQEVRARGAITLVVAEEGDDKVDKYADHIFRVPSTPTLYLPLLTVIPLQYLPVNSQEQGIRRRSAA